jgi:hypothetical protein
MLVATALGNSLNYSDFFRRLAAVIQEIQLAAAFTRTVITPEKAGIRAAEGSSRDLILARLLSFHSGFLLFSVSIA